MATGSENTITQSVEALGIELHNTLLLRALTQYVPAESKFEGGSTNTTTKLDKEDPRWKWRRFLDTLCELCCFDFHGKTINSLGVENRDGHARFWIAANQPSHAATCAKHLQLIFKLLCRTAVPPGQLGNTAKRICEASIEQAESRVKEYQKNLGQYLEKLDEYLEQMDAHSPCERYEDRLRISSQLENIATTPDDQVYEIASRAYSFSKTVDYRNLTELATSEQGVYCNLRHLAGRLCSWHRASAFVTQQAPEFIQILREPKFKTVSGNPSTTASSIDVARTVEEAFARVFQSHHPITPMASQKLAYCQQFLNSPKNRDKRPLVHAEATVAHRFSTQKLSFVFGDPYIACTKPSCRACDLYLNALGFVGRPCHGNVWFAWSMPKSKTDFHKHDSEILRNMASVVRREVESSVAGDTYGRRQRFQSTTGMSGQVLQAQIRLQK